MSKAAILVLADTETHADFGRVVNALVATKEFKDAGDDVRLIFDGAGTQWPGVLSDPEHQAGLAGQLRWRPLPRPLTTADFTEFLERYSGDFAVKAT